MRNDLRAEADWPTEVQAELGASCQIPTVVTNDVRYQDRDPRHLHDVLTAIRNRATLEEIHAQLPPNSERVLKAGDELRPLFRGHEDALARTAELAQECRLPELAFRQVRFPGYPVPEGETLPSSVSSAGTALASATPSPPPSLAGCRRSWT